MEHDKNSVKVQDILRKFEANKLSTPREKGCRSTRPTIQVDAVGLIASSNLRQFNIRPNLNARRSAPSATRIRSNISNNDDDVPHLNPILELRRLRSGRPVEPTTMMMQDATKRSVSEIAQLFQAPQPATASAVSLKANSTAKNDGSDVTTRVGRCLIKEIDQKLKSKAAAADDVRLTSSVIPAPRKPVRTFAHDVYMNTKLVSPTSSSSSTRDPVQLQPVAKPRANKPANKSAMQVTITRADSDKASCKPTLPPKPVARAKTVPIMSMSTSTASSPKTNVTSTISSPAFKVGPQIVRPSGPPPKPPLNNKTQLSRTKSAVDKTMIGIVDGNIKYGGEMHPLMKRSFSDEHIYDIPGRIEDNKDADVHSRSLLTTTATSDDEFIIVENVVYGKNYAPYALPCREKMPVDDTTTCLIVDDQQNTHQPKELHYMSTPIVTFPRGHEDARRCRSRSVSGRKLQRGSGLASRTLGRSRRVVTDEDLVNWSFSSVYATTPRRPSHATSTNNSGKDNDSGDSDPEISEKQVRERIAYIHRISRGPSLKAESKMNDFSYRHQYDAVLTVGLQFSADGSSLQPFVKDVFPRADSVKVNLDTVARFCFPDAESWRPSSTGETHTFVLTNELGGRHFGYCRKVKPEGANSSLPIVYCVLSPILARAYYAQVLVEIEKRHGLSDVQMKGFLQALHNRSVPHPGRTIHLRCCNTDVDVRVALSRYNDFGLDNGDTFRLLTRLSISNLLKIYSCLLLERRVLFCSSSLNTLTESVMALVALLYPFSWQHTLVPVLPTAMLDVVASPTPYVIGVMSSAQSQLDEVAIEEGIVVDLDESRVISEAGDEETILPKKIQKGITASLKFVKHRSEVAGSPSSSLISEAFLTMFAKLVGHYHDHAECLPDGRKIFKRDSFCAAPTSRSERLFLEWFTETQMFQIFIEDKMAQNHSVQQDVFERHIEKQRAEAEFYKPTIRTNVFGFGKKVINFGEKLIGMK